MSNFNTTQLKVGEKIRNFRKRADLSQLELEAEIHAAPGSISRLEAGKVNPTKETILQLGKMLKLSEGELSDLLGVKPLLPTREEVENAITECKSYLDREDVIAYLLDENGIVYYVSEGFTRLLNLTNSQVKSFIGKEILEIALDPKNEILQYLDFEKNKRVFAIETVRISQASNIAESYLKDVFKQIPRSDEIMALIPSISSEEVLSTANKKAYFNVDGKGISFSYGRERLKFNPRFEIIEFTNLKNS